MIQSYPYSIFFLASLCARYHYQIRQHIGLEFFCNLMKTFNIIQRFTISILSIHGDSHFITYFDSFHTFQVHDVIPRRPSVPLPKYIVYENILGFPLLFIKRRPSAPRNLFIQKTLRIEIARPFDKVRAAALRVLSTKYIFGDCILFQFPFLGAVVFLLCASLVIYLFIFRKEGGRQPKEKPSEQSLGNLRNAISRWMLMGSPGLRSSSTLHPTNFVLFFKIQREIMILFMKLFSRISIQC